MYKATLHTKSRKNSNNENPNKPSKYTIASSLIDEEEFKLGKTLSETQLNALLDWFY